jgi:DNA helicase-2/ATP-dependent DNA helicase PcrA
MTTARALDSEHTAELSSERAVNERYLREHRLKVAEKRRIQAAAVGPANGRFLGTGTPTLPLPTDVEVLAGRVAFDIDDPLVGHGFYISSWHHEWDGVLVVSWAAPIARLFYAHLNVDDELARHLVARRTLIARGDDLIDFDDEPVGPIRPDTNPFAVNGKALRVPAAPAAKARPLRHIPSPLRTGPTESSTPHSGTRPAAPILPTVSAATPLPPKLVLTEPSIAATPTIELRAERVVLDAVNRPRTGQLGSVLATLQPDQYRLVTWPDDIPLLVQGQPGTGKTIIAVHRAAYLTNGGREVPPPLKRVLLVGPSRAYVDHVTASVRHLQGSESSIVIVSLTALLVELAGLGHEPLEEPAELLDTDPSWAELVRKAAILLDARGRLHGKPIDRVRTLVTALTGRVSALDSLVTTDEQRLWLRQLGTFERARRNSRYLPFLAAAGVAVRPIADRLRWQHLLIDEAQDVRPLEWWILSHQLQTGAGGAISLFGDMNQRHSDWSCTAWSDIVAQLGRRGKGADRPQTVDCGFRSTKGILDFANQLLPRGEHNSRPLRDGTAPIVRKVTIHELGQAAAATADELSIRYPSGTVAVITTDQTAVWRQLRKMRWARSPRDDYGWICDSRTIVVIDPSRARGLEFDAVVVVEPAAFPVNLGRHGVLYTSLTRATQELSVIHARPLPDELRPPRR